MTTKQAQDAFIQGFMAKCAEYGVDGRRLIKLAQAATKEDHRVGPTLQKTRFAVDKEGPRGEKMVIRDFSDGHSTTNTANGYGSMPFAKDQYGHLVDPAADVAGAAGKGGYIDPEFLRMTESDRDTFLASTPEGTPILNPSGTNLVHNALRKIWDPGMIVGSGGVDYDPRFKYIPRRRSLSDWLSGFRPHEKVPNYDYFARILGSRAGEDPFR